MFVGSPYCSLLVGDPILSASFLQWLQALCTSMSPTNQMSLIAVPWTVMISSVTVLSTRSMILFNKVINSDTIILYSNKPFSVYVRTWGLWAASFHCVSRSFTPQLKTNWFNERQQNAPTVRSDARLSSSVTAAAQSLSAVLHHQQPVRAPSPSFKQPEPVQRWPCSARRPWP